MLTGVALARRSGDRMITPPPFAADAGFETLFDGTALGDWKMSTIRNQPGRDDPGTFLVRAGRSKRALVPIWAFCGSPGRRLHATSCGCSG